MNKIIAISLLLTMFLGSKCLAESSFKTFTPLPSNYNYHKYHSPNKYRNNIHKHRNHNNRNNRGYNYHPYNTYFYNKSPYYNGYYPKRTIISNLKNFFDGGQITGYTPSYNSSFDDNFIIYDSDNNFIPDNYDFQTGATVKILD